MRVCVFLCVYVCVYLCVYVCECDKRERETCASFCVPEREREREISITITMARMIFDATKTQVGKKMLIGDYI